MRRRPDETPTRTATGDLHRRDSSGVLLVCALCAGPGRIGDSRNEFTSFPPNWFKDPPNLQTFDYIFTGKVPETYEQRGALRSMISSEVRDVPRAILNSVLVATAVMLINIVLGSLAAYAYARLRFPGKRAAFTLS
ncbi:MAG: hypothetical protein R2839_06055 [Thermomicrobiales bacterium]